MKYYSHHIGDFKSATAHLLRLERGIYRELLDMYYDTELPLPLELSAVCHKIAARSNEESTAVEQMLNEFFTKTSTGWFHARCEEEIARFKSNSSQKALAGKASAASKALLRQQALNARSNPLEQDDSESQLTGNRKPLTTILNTGADAPPGLPPCPAQEIVDLYHAALPTLPTVRLLGEKRRKALSVFWRFVLTSKRTDGEPRATNAQQALAWITDYFRRAKDNDFLMGRGPRSGDHAGWECDIDYLISERGQKQVIEKTRDPK